MLQLESPCLASAHTARHFGFLEGFIFFLVCLPFSWLQLPLFRFSLALLKSYASLPRLFKGRTRLEPTKTTRTRQSHLSWISARSPLEAAFLNLYQWTPWCAISLFITSDNWFSVCKVVSTVFVHIISYFSHKAPPSICECHDYIVF